MKTRTLRSDFFYLIVLLLLSFIITRGTVYAGAINSEFIYRSPEERREAGLKTELTDWLLFSGLLEIERSNEKFIYDADFSDIDFDEDTEVLQLGFDIDISDDVGAELIFEYEKDENNKSHTIIEEAVLIIELDKFEFELGKHAVPFGEFYSHFISDPALSFGEKLDENIVITLEANDNIDIAVFASEGNASKSGEKTRDWGANVEFRNEDESIKIAVGYLSDLADTDEMLLQDFANIYQNKVAALNANALLGFQSYEITAEFVTALDDFVELDEEMNHPSAYNLELAYFPNPDIRFALRAEASKELEDAAAEQYGISSTFVFARSMTFSAEYLTGRFKRGFVLDDEDEAFDRIETFALSFTFAF